MIVQQFENLDPNSSTPTQAEVPLTLMITLAQELKPEQKQASLEQNHHYQLISYVLSKDHLNTYACFSQHPLTLDKYIEMIYRWSFFYKGENLCQLIHAFFFNEKLMQNRDANVVKMTCSYLNKIVIKNINDIV